VEASGAVAVTGEASGNGAAAAGVAEDDAGALEDRRKSERGAGRAASADGDGTDGGGGSGGGGGGGGGGPRPAVAAKISAARRLARKLSEEKVTADGDAHVSEQELASFRI